MSFWIGVKGTIQRIVYKLNHSVRQLSFYRRDLWPAKKPAARGDAQVSNFTMLITLM